MNRPLTRLLRKRSPLLALVFALSCSETPVGPEPEARGLSAHDAPRVIVSTFLLTDQDPCTGEMFDVMVVQTFRIQGTMTNTTIHVTRVYTTSHGYEGFGEDSQVMNDNAQVGTTAGVKTIIFVDVLRNPETGQQFQVRGQVVLDQRIDGIRLDNLTLTCVG
jgi:hypothetical protein